MILKPIHLFGTCAGIAAFLATNVSAQDYHWSGGGDATTWSQNANWVEGTPPPLSAHAIYIGTGFPTVSPLPITIGPSDAVQTTDQLFGPEWGQTLNIYGTVNVGFGIAEVGDLAGPKSTVNMFGSSTLTSGDSIFIGDMFWFAGAPNVDFNLYDSSHLTTSYLIVGGHLNLFGGTVTVNTAVLTGTPTAGQFGGISTDATRLMDLAGGQMILAGDQSAAVQDWITRGIIEGYGGTGSINVDLLSMPGSTIVTGIIPEPCSLALMALGATIALFSRRDRSTR